MGRSQAPTDPNEEAGRGAPLRHTRGASDEGVAGLGCDHHPAHAGGDIDSRRLDPASASVTSVAAPAPSRAPFPSAFFMRRLRRADDRAALARHLPQHDLRAGLVVASVIPMAMLILRQRLTSLLTALPIVEHKR
mgnify:CR=1 FL=1